MLAGVLGQCSSLATLNLENNVIGAAGAGSLAGMLGKCPSLATLNLGGNNIGPEGTQSLAPVLGQCSCLAELDLANNGIGAEGAEVLASVLAQPSLLVKLNFRGNDITMDGKRILQSMLISPCIITCEVIDFRITAQDGSSVYFRMMETTKLEKALDKYCQREGITMEQVAFLFKGRQFVTQRHKGQNLLELGMEEDAVITARILSQAYFDFSIQAQDGSSVYFRQRRETRLQKALTKYCERKGITMEQVIFLYRGHQLQDGQNPLELGMEEDAVITARILSQANIDANVQNPTRPEAGVSS